VNEREIISKTMTNMYNIYLDVARVINVIEDEVKNKNLISISSDSNTMWENSSSYFKPDGWLPSWFARVYQEQKQDLRAVGFCIHLGGERCNNYYQDFLIPLKIPFPFINISLIETETDITKIKRPSLNNIFWGAGWCNQDSVNSIEHNSIVYSEDDSIVSKVRLTTYFIDLLELNTKEKIDQMVVTPMVKLLGGDEEWIIENNIPILHLEDISPSEE